MADALSQVLASPLRASSIAVELRGEATVAWSQQAADDRHVTSAGARRWYEASEQYVDERHDILLGGADDLLAAGQHRFPVCLGYRQRSFRQRAVDSKDIFVVDYGRGGRPMERTCGLHIIGSVDSRPVMHRFPKSPRPIFDYQQRGFRDRAVDSKKTHSWSTAAEEAGRWKERIRSPYYQKRRFPRCRAPV